MNGDRLPVTIGMIINQYSDAFLKRSRGCVRVVSFISDLYFDELIDQVMSELKNIKFDYRKKVHEEDGFILSNYSIIREMRQGT